jgi:hypothetical protein
LGSNSEAAISENVVQAFKRSSGHRHCAGVPAIRDVGRIFLRGSLVATHDAAGLVAALAIDFPDDDRAVRIATPLG